MRRSIVTLAAVVTLALVTSLSAQQTDDGTADPQTTSTGATTSSQQTSDDMAQPQSMSSSTTTNSQPSDMQVVPGTPWEDGKPIDYSKNPYWGPNEDWGYIEATAGGD